MSPYIIPFFIVHEGCPYRCIFCDQRQISGSITPVSKQSIIDEIEARLAAPRRNPESAMQVAFYGGTFTSLSRSRQDELLGAVQPYLNVGKIQSIRISTRPDEIDSGTAEYLFERGVRLVELGVQSMDSNVLEASGRGYTPEQVEKGFEKLQNGGMEVGAQLMVGLPGETTIGAIAGARHLVNLKPACVRLYPTLVVGGSELEKDYTSGLYRPLSLNHAVALTTKLKKIFDEHGIPVIRIGLQAGKSLEDNLVAGPYHPSFGEYVKSRMLFLRVRAQLHAQRGQANLQLSLAATDESLFRGPGNCNIKRLNTLGLMDGVELKFNLYQQRNTVQIERV